MIRGGRAPGCQPELPPDLAEVASPLPKPTTPAGAVWADDDVRRVVELANLDKTAALNAVALRLEGALAVAMKDPRVSSKAAETKGWANNIGKYVSLAYLEAEAAGF